MINEKEKAYREKWEMINHNLLCYSETYLLKPKKEYEKEHKETLQELYRLRKEIEEHGFTFAT